MKINRNSGAEQPNPLPQQPTPVRRAPKAAPIRQETYDDPEPDDEEDENAPLYLPLLERRDRLFELMQDRSLPLILYMAIPVAEESGQQRKR